jgi:hypothetical protein
VEEVVHLEVVKELVYVVMAHTVENVVKVNILIRELVM